MFNFFQPQKYHHLSRVLISRSNLEFNFSSLQTAHLEAKVAPVLKSNAYGHGLRTIAPLFDSLKPPFLIVDSLYEAYELKKLKLSTPILILGYTHPDNLRIKKLPFHFAIFDFEVARALNEKQKNCPVHLFIDTGIYREGVTLEELPSFLNELKKFKNLDVVGVTSHFADADNPTDSSFNDTQITNFKRALEIINAHGYSPIWRHISASGGTFKVKDPTFNLIRVGLSSYGINPLEEKDPFFKTIELKPVLTFVSSLAQIKTINKGETIGYSRTFTASRKMKVGLIPAGYYDGVDRRLSNIGVVEVGGKMCSILGRVSMNMTVVDVSKVKNVKVGDTVTIYSNENKNENSLVNASKKCHTIPYEFLVHLAESLKREVVD